MMLNIRHYRIALFILALLGLSFALLTTSKYGAGVSSDAVRAMSTAEGLMAGKGFTDFTGAPYILWPPLYPLVLAGLSYLTHFDIFHSAWYLNLLLFPLNIWLWGILFERIFSGRLAYALFGSAAALISSSTVRIYANVASDPLFVTFMILFFLAGGDYLKTPSRRALWWMFILAGLSMLQRYLGIVLFGVGGLIVLSKEGWRGILKIILPAGLSFLPSGIWLIVHNYLGYGTIFGGRSYDQMWPLENMSLSMTKILHWFLPYLPGLRTLLLNPWSVILPLILILALLNLKSKTNWRAWAESLMGIYVWPALVFAVIYYLLLAFTVNTIDHRDLTSDRYYIIVFPVILVFVFFTIEHLIVPHLSGNRIIYTGAIACAVLWLVYPIYDLQEYMRKALVQGEPSNYNIYNSSYFTEMKITKVGRELVQAQPQDVFYSNYVNLLWFQYHRPIHVLLPVDNSLPQAERIAVLRKDYPGWPGGESGYIIWYTPNEYKYLASPADLSLIAHLELVYKDDHGEIYRVTPK